MKKTLLFVSFIAIVGLVTAQQTTTSRNVKIGCVSLQEIIVTMPEAKKADTVLQDFQKELQTNYMEMVKEYQQKDSIFKADSATWNATKRDFKKNDLVRLVQQIQTSEQSVEQQLQKKQQELVTPIREKVIEAIRAVAQKHDYTQVLEKSVVYYYTPTDDIAPLVKKELDKKEVKPAVKVKTSGKK